MICNILAVLASVTLVILLIFYIAAIVVIMKENKLVNTFREMAEREPSQNGRDFIFALRDVFFELKEGDRDIVQPFIDVIDDINDKSKNHEL